jgi:hypothetical protein
MNYNAQKEQISTAGILPLLEPVPIFIREEAGVRSFGGDARKQSRITNSALLLTLIMTYSAYQGIFVKFSYFAFFCIIFTA